MIQAGNGNDGMELPTVNRWAMVLEPTQAYLQWARECPEGDPELTLDELREETAVFLIPETDAGPKTWLAHNYVAMFEHELDAWCPDETFWPQDRSLQVFQQFFEIRFCSMVVDMGQGPIERDAE